MSRCSLSFRCFAKLLCTLPILGVLAHHSHVAASDAAYCGLYSVHGALAAVGIERDFDDLLQPQYITSKNGSTLAELRQAVRDSGAYAIPLTRLSADSLRNSQHPMILHVASEGQLQRYQHWILFLGMQNGEARIYDPSRSVESMTLADVMSRWDGTALVVSEEAITPNRITSFEKIQLVTLFVIGMMIVGFVHFLRAVWHRRHTGADSRRPSVLIGTQAAILILASTAVGLGSHLLDSDGFLQNKNATSYIAALTLDDFLPTLSLQEMERIVEDEASASDTVIIDARSVRSFANGHIPGAINVPVRMIFTPAYRQAILEDVAQSDRIIVYCQSLGCAYDEKVATALVSDGYTNVSLFPEGWREWKLREQHAD